LPKSEIDNFDIFVRVEQQVFWFQITVDDGVLERH
jgi:hypothetical protein